MKWYYNKDGLGVKAETQPEGFNYNFRGVCETEELSEEKLIDAIELEDLKSQYMKKYGRKPNGRAKAETLRKALEDDSEHDNQSSAS